MLLKALSVPLAAIAGLGGATVKVVEGPAAPAVLPASSDAVPDGRLIPIVPVPVIELIVTVRVAPDPVTTIDP